MNIDEKPVSLHCKQEIANELLDKDPTLFNHIAEKMHYEIGKALADKISDGQTYIVKMDKPFIDPLGAVNWECTAIRSNLNLDVLVRCKDCKRWQHENWDYGICDIWDKRLSKNFYCGFGEYREDKTWK